MAAALVVVTVMAMLSAAMLTLRGSMAKRQLGALDAKRAFYIAEAGLAEGAASLALGGNGNVASPTDPARFGDGIFWTEALVPIDGYTELTSTALSGSGRCTLQLVVRSASDPIGNLGLFGDQTVALGSQAKVLGYDSSAEEEPAVKVGMKGETAEPDVPARVASNGMITLAAGTKKHPTKISGDAIPGPEGRVVLGLNSSVSGSTAPGSEAEVLPTIALPSLPPIGTYVAMGGGTKTLPSNEGRYSTIRVQTGTVLSIAGPAQIQAVAFVVEAGATLELDTTLGGIELYVEDDLVLAAGSTIVCPNPEAKSCSIYHTGDPSAYGTTPSLTLAATGTLYAKVFAPHLTLTLPASLDVYGALAARSVTLASGAEFRYDIATASGGAGGAPEAAMPLPVAWRVLELPEAVKSLANVDPIKALGLDKDALRKPSDAHDESTWLICFTAIDGNNYTYIGSESEFNYAKVATVITTATPADANFTGMVQKLLKKP
ncbi:MAG: hypothetical protein FJ299_05305 [Planctomycetes bacterium]|nr:hypothetical protein [Planctomycetota bacterium]